MFSLSRAVTTWRPLSLSLFAAGGVTLFSTTALTLSEDKAEAEAGVFESADGRRRLRVGVLGATGTVGQRFLERLEDHPWFEVTALGASSRSSGRKYADATKWQLGADIPRAMTDLTVTECRPEHFGDCDFVFSALDSSVAGEVELAFADAGFPVFSNARNHRQGADIPLVVPPVNGTHLDVVQHQKWWKTGGFIVTNANCSSTGLCIALKPIADAFGIKKCALVTMQAISGAGYPGVPTLDSLDNVFPHISGEEDKLENEPGKILGKARSSGPDYWDRLKFPITAHANRVPVKDGHMICVSLELEKKASPEDVAAVLATYTPQPLALSALPSAPKQWIQVRTEVDRPQPIKDRNTGAGYTTVVGRIREDPLFDVKMVVLSHNTVMGAAGSSILNAELAVTRGLLRARK